MNQLNMFLLGEDAGINFILQAAEDLAQPIEIENLERRAISRNEHYFEQVVPQYFDDQFKEHFRMSRATFQGLINVVWQAMGQERGNIPLPKKIMFTIWMLSKPESFLAAGIDLG